MKPPPFEYHAPASLEEVLALLAEHGGEAKVLAGGQSLMPLLNFRLAEPTLLVDLNTFSGLDTIRLTDDGSLSLGAMTRQRAVERSPEVAEYLPLLAEAMPHIAHPQIRNRGTVGGSLVHADPAAELPVIAVAADARFRLQKAGDERWVEAAEFFYGMFMTALEPDEVLAEVVFPALPPHTGTAFVEVSRRRGDYAMMGLAALVTLDDGGTVERARLVYLNAGIAPVDARQAAAALVGERPSAVLFEEAAQIASETEIDPLGGVHATVEYQRHLAHVLTIRALTTAVERAG